MRVGPNGMLQQITVTRVITFLHFVCKERRISRISWGMVVGGPAARTAPGGDGAGGGETGQTQYQRHCSH